MILECFDLKATLAQEFLLARERAVFANDDPGDSVQQNCAAAHRAWRQGRVQHTLAIDAGGLAAGVLKRIHFPVQDDTALLHTTIVSATDDATLMDDHRADRDSALGESSLGFVNCRLHEFVHRVLR